MLAEISSRQFEEWRAYGDLEPFDETRADIRTAQIVQTLSDLAIARTGRRPRSKLQDFLLRFGDDAAPPRTPKQARKQVMEAMKLMREIFSPPRPHSRNAPQRRRSKKKARR